MEHVDMGWATNKVLKSPSFWSWPSSGDSERRSHGPRRVLAMQVNFNFNLQRHHMGHFV